MLNTSPGLAPSKIDFGTPCQPDRRRRSKGLRAQSGVRSPMGCFQSGFERLFRARGPENPRGRPVVDGFGGALGLSGWPNSCGADRTRAFKTNFAHCFSPRARNADFEAPPQRPNRPFSVPCCARTVAVSAELGASKPMFVGRVEHASETTILAPQFSWPNLGSKAAVRVLLPRPKAGLGLCLTSSLYSI